MARTIAGHVVAHQTAWLQQQQSGAMQVRPGKAGLPHAQRSAAQQVKGRPCLQRRCRPCKRSEHWQVVAVRRRGGSRARMHACTHELHVSPAPRHRTACGHRPRPQCRLTCDGSGLALSTTAPHPSPNRTHVAAQARSASSFGRVAAPACTAMRHACPHSLHTGWIICAPKQLRKHALMAAGTWWSAAKGGAARSAWCAAGPQLLHAVTGHAPLRAPRTSVTPVHHAAHRVCAHHQHIAPCAGAHVLCGRHKGQHEAAARGCQVKGDCALSANSCLQLHGQSGQHRRHAHAYARSKSGLASGGFANIISIHSHHRGRGISPSKRARHVSARWRRQSL